MTYLFDKIIDLCVVHDMFEGKLFGSTHDIIFVYKLWNTMWGEQQVWINMKIGVLCVCVLHREMNDMYGKMYQNKQ